MDLYLGGYTTKIAPKYLYVESAQIPHFSVSDHFSPNFLQWFLDFLEVFPFFRSHFSNHFPLHFFKPKSPMSTRSRVPFIQSFLPRPRRCPSPWTERMPTRPRAPADTGSTPPPNHRSTNAGWPETLTTSGIPTPENVFNVPLKTFSTNIEMSIQYFRRFLRFFDFKIFLDLDFFKIFEGIFYYRFCVDIFCTVENCPGKAKGPCRWLGQSRQQPPEAVIQECLSVAVGLCVGRVQPDSGGTLLMVNDRGSGGAPPRGRGGWLGSKPAPPPLWHTRLLPVCGLDPDRTEPCGQKKMLKCWVGIFSTQ